MTTEPFPLDAAARFVDPYGHDTHAELSVRIGISVQSILRAKKRGGLELHQVERIAHHVGVHPATIWPSYYDVTIAMAERMEATRQRSNCAKRARRAA